MRQKTLKKITILGLISHMFGLYMIIKVSNCHHYDPLHVKADNCVNIICLCIVYCVIHFLFGLINHNLTINKIIRPN